MEKGFERMSKWSEISKLKSNARDPTIFSKDMYRPNSWSDENGDPI